MNDLIEKVAALLYCFEGSPATPDAQARDTEEIYRNRATALVLLVRNHDEESA